MQAVKSVSLHNINIQEARSWTTVGPVLLFCVCVCVFVCVCESTWFYYTVEVTFERHFVENTLTKYGTQSFLYKA